MFKDVDYNDRLMRRLKAILFLIPVMGIVCFLAFQLIYNNMQGRAANAKGAVTSIDDLGSINHYNGVLFKSFSATKADCEGALAVGGQSFVVGTDGQHYDIGAAYEYASSDYRLQTLGVYGNDNGYPSVLLNVDNMNLGAALGSPAKNGYYNMFGGKAVFSDKTYSKYDNLGVRFSSQDGYQGEYTVSDDIAAKWFNKQYGFAKAASEQYANANNSSVTLKDYGDGSYVSGEASYKNVNLGKHLRDVDTSNILVINVQTDASVVFDGSVWWPQYWLHLNTDWTLDGKYDLVIYNFPNAVNVELLSAMTLGNYTGDPNWQDQHLNANQIARRNGACQKTIFNFPKAENIKMQEFLLWGTLLAPDAKVSAKGGSVNGQLIASELEATGGFELHAFKLKDIAVDIVEVEDEEETKDVEITKYLYFNYARDVVLGGAKFKLYKYDGGSRGELVTDKIITNTYGSYVIKDLPEGEYLLVETEPPQYGFLNDYDAALKETYFEYPFTVSGGDEIPESMKNDAFYSIDEDGVIQIIRYNAPEVFTIEFEKQDSVTHTALNGALFNLDRAGDALYPAARMKSNIATSDDGKIVMMLPLGTYSLYEIEAPEGYSLGGPWVFSVDENGTVEYLDGFNQNGVVENDPLEEEKYKVVIIKYDEATGEYEGMQGLEGARFDLYRKDESDSYQIYGDYDIITNEYGFYTIPDLPSGDYRLVETQAPAGYIITEDGDTYFTVGENESPESEQDDSAAIVLDKDGYFEIRIANEKLKADVDLVKKSVYQIQAFGSDAPYEIEESLEGVEFDLYSVTGDNYLFVSKSETDGNGTIVFKDLEAGNYMLVEDETLDGYQILEEPIAFTLSFDAGNNPVIALDNGSDPEIVSVRDNGFGFEIYNQAHYGSLEIIKISTEVFQSGFDDDEEKKIIYTYLEGAVFQLQRRVDGSGSYEDFGEQFQSKKTGENDTYGIETAAARLDHLPVGQYRIIELSAPAGYITGRSDGVIGTFRITGSMAETEQKVSITVTNEVKAAKDEIKVQKVDLDTGEGLPNVEFKLWLIKKGAENWESSISVEDVIAGWDSYEFGKYASQHVSDENGWVSLGELKPGIYALYEAEPPEGYMFNLQPRTTKVPGASQDMSLDFYYHVVAFKVVAIDENDTDAGVRIQWVHRPKIATLEAVFDSIDQHDVENAVWDKDNFEKDDYTSFQFTNRRLKLPQISFRKVDAETKEPLSGAEFTLYSEEIKEPEEGEEAAEAYPYWDIVGVYESDADGNVVLDLPEDYVSKAEYADHMIGKFKLVESKAPTGYEGTFEPYYFELVIDPVTKGIVMNELDEDGDVIAENVFVSYKEPEAGELKGSYIDSIVLPDVENKAKRGSFTIVKELEEASNRDEEFVFQITYDPEGAAEVFYGTLAVPEGELKAEITFAQLKYGTYLIEEPETNWRYIFHGNDLTDGTFILGEDTTGGKITFWNKRENDKWISDKNSVINKMNPLEVSEE